MLAVLLSLTLPLHALEQDRWQLLYEEDFSQDLIVEQAPWVKDPLGRKSPWQGGEFGDDGRYFRANGGADFLEQLAAFDTYRKRVAFGKDGWLTAELAARDRDKDGKPEDPPALGRRRLVDGRWAGGISVPSHQSALLIRSTRPLPEVYRVEAVISGIGVGGSRDGRWDYDGKTNGYTDGAVMTHHPWPWGASDSYRKPYEDWPSVKDTNGFYFLAIMDYRDPAPHNNIFIHTHRKAVIDMLNNPQPGEDSTLCDPVTGSLRKSRDNAVTMFFLTSGRREESKPVMMSDCKAAPAGSLPAAAQLSADQRYLFVVERSSSGFTLEVSGVFRGIGQRTLRYARRFSEDGVAIWHHDRRRYPEHFIIGDPHLNFYQGEAVVEAVRLYGSVGLK